MLPKVNLNPLVASVDKTPTATKNTNGMISFTITPSIDISPGYTVPENGDLKWQWSCDQHALKFFIQEQQNEQGQTEYVVKLIGTLYYSLSLTGLTPICSAFLAQPNAYPPTAFSTYGSYHIDEVIGTYPNVTDIQHLDFNNLFVTNVANQLVSIGTDGKEHEINLSDPSSLKEILEQSNTDILVFNQFTIQATHQVNVSYQNPPIS